jgi:hypothetical protein
MPYDGAPDFHFLPDSPGQITEAPSVYPYRPDDSGYSQPLCQPGLCLAGKVVETAFSLNRNSGFPEYVKNTGDHRWQYREEIS